MPHLCHLQTLGIVANQVKSNPQKRKKKVIPTESNQPNVHRIVVQSQKKKKTDKRGGGVPAAMICLPP